MVKSNRSTERGLWIAFVAFFGVIVAAAYLPTRPLVVVFPAWSLVVLVAAVCTIAVAAVAAFGYGWPAEGTEG